MASASSALLLPPLSGLECSPIKSSFLIPFQIRSNPNPIANFSPKKYRIIAAAVAVASSSDREREEESRWLREEQRWLREEQRWLREESRWRSERESLVREIASLRLKIEALERERPVDATIRRISEVGPLPALVEEVEVKEMIFEEVVRVSEENVEATTTTKKKENGGERKTLRMGSEGEEVRAMQEALLKLGFYSGEEDMEFSSFSSGTERAVKTWQASLGTSEDGVMTSKLLERLFTERCLDEYTNQGGDFASGPVGGTNGAPVATVSEITEIKETIIKDTGDKEIEASSHRVFLLGENRWEEPSRLIRRDKPIGANEVAYRSKCITCGGQGRLTCTECDGSGEPNIEPQFLEWVGEDTKCPYCEGLGLIVCDVCEGNDVAVQL